MDYILCIISVWRNINMSGTMFIIHQTFSLLSLSLETRVLEFLDITGTEWWETNQFGTVLAFYRLLVSYLHRQVWDCGVMTNLALKLEYYTDCFRSFVYKRSVLLLDHLNLFSYFPVASLTVVKFLIILWNWQYLSPGYMLDDLYRRYHKSVLLP